MVLKCQGGRHNVEQGVERRLFKEWGELLNMHAM